MCEDSFFTDKCYLLNTVLVEYCSSEKKKEKVYWGKSSFCVRKHD